METFPWITSVVALAAVLIGAMWWMRRGPRVAPLPTEWALSARPVFSTDERRVYKLLRDALPHHVVLSKLPLVRFSQPADPNEVRYWYDLLGSIHVTFAVCSVNGRVLAAIDLDTDRSNSRRALQIKQSVLGACRVRYLRCPVDHLPSIAELQLLVPSATATARASPNGLAPTSGLDEARDSLASTVATRRAQRTALSQDSSLFQDSFFAPDSRLDGFANSEFNAPASGAIATAIAARTSGPIYGSALAGTGGALSRRAHGEAEDEGGSVVDDLPAKTVAASRR